MTNQLDNELAKHNCKALLKVVKARELSHLAVRDWKKRVDRILKIGALVSSTATTYAVTSQSENIDETTLFIERILSFTTTILTGLTAMYNNERKADLHDKSGNEYAKLANMIDVKIQSDCCTIEDFHHFSHLYREMRESATALSEWVKKKHPEACKNPSELQELESQSRYEDDKLIKYFYILLR